MKSKKIRPLMLVFGLIAGGMAYSQQASFYPGSSFAYTSYTNPALNSPSMSCAFDGHLTFIKMIVVNGGFFDENGESFHTGDAASGTQTEGMRGIITTIFPQDGRLRQWKYATSTRRDIQTLGTAKWTNVSCSFYAVLQGEKINDPLVLNIGILPIARGGPVLPTDNPRQPIRVDYPAYCRLPWQKWDGANYIPFKFDCSTIGVVSPEFIIQTEFK